MNTSNIMERSSQGQQSNPQQTNEPTSALKEKAQAFQEAALEWQRKATEATRRAAIATDDYVHENPWSIMGYVAIGCFAIGYLLGRSRD